MLGSDEVVDVEEVGPPVVLTVVSVGVAAGPRRPIAPVGAQAHVDHDHQHVGRCQSGSATKQPTAW